MDTEHDLAQNGARSRLHPALAAALEAERSRPPEAGEAEQVEAERSMHAIHRDPTLATHDAADVDAETPEAVDPQAKARTHVRWVRPTELAMQGGARATGWGLDLRAELGRRIRDARIEHREHRAEARSEREERLPDLSIRGRRRPVRHEPERAGMGLR
jgi:hypothetical protein